MIRRAAARHPNRWSFTLVEQNRALATELQGISKGSWIPIIPTHMAKQELSEYEKQRQENIAERDALLKKLSLEAANAGFGPKTSKLTNESKAPRKKTLAKKVKEETLPRRTSSRIAGLEADSEVAKRKALEEHEAVQEAARLKRQRISGDLELKNIVLAGKEWDRSENFLVDVLATGARPYERTFGDTEVKATSDKELRAMREKLSGLELYEGFEPNKIKITPERIYSLSFHPEPSKALIFAGDKLGNLGIFDASQTGAGEHGGIKEEDDDIETKDQAEPAIASFRLHTRTISSFQVSPVNSSHIYTCSYDSSIRLLDLETSTSTEIYGPTDPEADEPLSGLEIDPVSPHVILFSRLDGFVGRQDTRAPTSETTLWQMSEKKIGGFSIHPQFSHFLATASLDRTMKLWDLRKTVSVKSGGGQPVCLGEHTSRLSVSHAAFNAVGQVATSSYDDTVKVFSFEGMPGWKQGAQIEDSAMEPTTIVKHNNQTGRWVTILRPQWQASPRDSVQRFVIGNMNRFVDIYTGAGEQLAQLSGEGITAVPAVAQFHPTNDWIAAGTASGKLCLWM